MSKSKVYIVYIYIYSCMQKTVYYLTHRDTGQRLRYYASRAGARIAQRSRNARLGFIQRIERIELYDNWEAEQCLDNNNNIVTATYCIVEDTVDSALDELTNDSTH
jgi:predicted GIY-YIG superfamily endonuclease